MAIIIRCALPEVGDAFIVGYDGSGLPRAKWQHGALGWANAIRFNSEGDAKSWLAAIRLDLNPTHTTFEQVA